MTEVVVVGGGLGGLTAAYRLRTTGRNVTLFEKRPLLGGKARSFTAGSPSAQTPFHPWDPDADLDWLTPTVDKGYHIFPGWYHELWGLLDEIGATDNFYPRERANRTEQSGGYALFMPPLEDLSPDATGRPEERLARSNNMKTLVPQQKWKLWQFGPVMSMALTGLGLASASGRTVEEMTVPDFVSTRWYNGMERASVLQDLIVKALANPSKHTSAYTMRQTFRRWIPTMLSGNPWTPPKGPLQQCLIDPIVDACDDLGVVIEFDELASMRRTGDAISELVFTSGRRVDTSDAQVVLALPADMLLDLLRTDPELLTIRSLSNLAHLRTAPMGALDLYFVDPDTPGYPKGLRPEVFTDRHFSLIESEFGLTGFPISNIPEWKPHLGGAPGLVLQFVCGNVLDVHEQPVDAFARLLIDEIAGYLGFEPERDLLGCVALPSSDEQLTMNDAGTWDKRPPADIKEISNLFLAGDFVKLSVDVAGMEAAVESGSNAARAILLSESIRANDPQTPEQWDEVVAEVETAIPRPSGLPSPWWQNVIWPVLRIGFVTVHHLLGWFVILARAPLSAGHDFVGSLHDRYEDHRDEIRRDGLGWHRLANWRRGRPRGVPVNQSIRERRKGTGEPMGGRDWLLVFAGWVAMVGGLVSAIVLATRIDGYSHVDDAISVLGREPETRAAYVAVTVAGWALFQLFAAVVRKFMPGSQVLVWMIAWFGFLWMVVGLFPVCDEVDGVRACGDAWEGISHGIHVIAALSMAVLLFAMPALTAIEVLDRLPQGYNANWAGFRRFSWVLTAVTGATGLYFALTVFDVVDGDGLAQRVHWTAGHVWLFMLGFWLFARRHRANDGSVAQPVGPLRSVDQRSLWA